jgi:hypothetical protein
VGAAASCAAYLPQLPGVEDVQHALFVCPLNSPVCARFPSMVPAVHAFLEQDPVLFGTFVAECQRTHAAAVAVVLKKGATPGPTPEHQWGPLYSNYIYHHAAFFSALRLLPLLVFSVLFPLLGTVGMEPLPCPLIPSFSLGLPCPLIPNFPLGLPGGLRQHSCTV